MLRRELKTAPHVSADAQCVCVHIIGYSRRGHIVERSVERRHAAHLCARRLHIQCVRIMHAGVLILNEI